MYLESNEKQMIAMGVSVLSLMNVCVMNGNVVVSRQLAQTALPEVIVAARFRLPGDPTAKDISADSDKREHTADVPFECSQLVGFARHLLIAWAEVLQPLGSEMPEFEAASSDLRRDGLAAPNFVFKMNGGRATGLRHVDDAPPAVTTYGSASPNNVLRPSLTVAPRPMPPATTSSLSSSSPRSRMLTQLRVDFAQTRSAVDQLSSATDTIDASWAIGDDSRHRDANDLFERVQRMKRALSQLIPRLIEEDLLQEAIRLNDDAGTVLDDYIRVRDALLTSTKDSDVNLPSAHRMKPSAPNAHEIAGTQEPEAYSHILDRKHKPQPQSPSASTGPGNTAMSATSLRNKHADTSSCEKPIEQHHEAGYSQMNDVIADVFGNAPEKESRDLHSGSYSSLTPVLTPSRPTKKEQSTRIREQNAGDTLSSGD